MILAVSSAAPAAVIDGPITFNGHTYLLLDEKGWVASEAEAVSLGGHLVTVNDLVENSFLFDTFSSFGGVTRSLWIGLTDTASEGAYVWTSGEPATFFAWEARAPDDCCDAAPHGEDYVHIENGPCWPEPGKWNDLSDRPSGRIEACSGSVAANGVVELPCAPCNRCGDADGDGRVAVTDGVQVLRTAAGLSSDCIQFACDVDRNGRITVTDGVNVLREAAGLSSVCPSK